MKKIIYLAFMVFLMMIGAASCESKTENKESEKSESESKSEQTEKTSAQRLSDAFEEMGDIQTADVDEMTEILKEYYPALEAFINSDPSEKDCKMIEEQYYKCLEKTENYASQLNEDEQDVVEEKYNKALKKAGYTEDFVINLASDLVGLLVNKLH